MSLQIDIFHASIPSVNAWCINESLNNSQRFSHLVPVYNFLDFVKGTRLYIFVNLLIDKLTKQSFHAEQLNIVHANELAI